MSVSKVQVDPSHEKSPKSPLTSIAEVTSFTFSTPEVISRASPEKLVRYSLPRDRDVVMSSSGRVDEALVVVAVKYSATASPTTDSGAYGEVVPIPRLLEKYPPPITSRA